MIKIYTRSASLSSRRAVKWLTDHQLTYTEIYVNRQGLKTEDLMAILSASSTGIEGLVSKRSHHYQAIEEQLPDMAISEFIDLARKDFELLRWPMIIDGPKLEIGFRESKMRVFLSRH